MRVRPVASVSFLVSSNASFHALTHTRGHRPRFAISPQESRVASFKSASLSTSVTPADIAHFRAILDPPASSSSNHGKIILPPSSPDDDDLLTPYTQDWTRKWKAPACPAVLQPCTTEQVSALLAYCNGRGIAVVPQGGNTGLVGGSIPTGNEVVLSLSRMNEIISFDPLSSVLTCEAGCILEHLSLFLRPHQHIMPLDLGAKGSCQIGGNVSTNAGGLRYLRYGSLHGNVLGLEVVLADGEVLNLLSTLRKDNTGYDLKQLFIGAEGTLGVITKISMHVPPAPAAVNVALVGLNSFEQVKTMVGRTREKLGEILSAMELLDAQSMEMVVGKKEWGLRNPLVAAVDAGGGGGSEVSPYPFYILLETAGSNEEHDEQKLENLLTLALEEDIIADGTLAQDVSQANDIWKLRELIPVAIEEEGRVHKYDVSVPLDRFYELVERTREGLREEGFGVATAQSAGAPAGGRKKGEEVKVVGYGHLGDSNLHLNVSVPRNKPDPPGVSRVLGRVLPWVMKQEGSVSAEHGLGQLKKEYLPLTKSRAAVAAMRGMKKMLDPKGILNPGKFFPEEKP